MHSPNILNCNIRMKERRELFDSGLSIFEVAKIQKCSRMAIRQWHDINYKKSKRTLPKGYRVLGERESIRMSLFLSRMVRERPKDIAQFMQTWAKSDGALLEEAERARIPIELLWEAN